MCGRRPEQRTQDSRLGLFTVDGTRIGAGATFAGRRYVVSSCVGKVSMHRMWNRSLRIDGAHRQRGMLTGQAVQHEVSANTHVLPYRAARLVPSSHRADLFVGRRYVASSCTDGVGREQPRTHRVRHATRCATSQGYSSHCSSMATRWSCVVSFLSRSVANVDGSRATAGWTAPGDSTRHAMSSTARVQQLSDSPRRQTAREVHCCRTVH